MRMVKLRYMADKIRQLVAAFINQYGKTKSWEEIRILYSVYTYVSFLVIAVKSMTGSEDNIDSRAVDLGFEARDNIEYIFSYPGAENILEETLHLLREEKQLDINALYQDYLSVDFVVDDNGVVFSGGKYNRDALGSYYTQEEFAYEITQRAIEAYVANCPDKPDEIDVVDFSCGGGAFLVAAKKICEKNNIKAKLIGIDVDPVAVMITRYRLAAEQADAGKTQVLLGNPLLENSGNTGSKDRFIMSLKGRYYNTCLGIDMPKKYSVVIGNPPWEKIRFEEKKFLAHYVPGVLIATKNNREKIIDATSYINKKFYMALANDYEKAKKEIKNNDAFLDTRGGELNTYAVFTEYALNHISKEGIVGLVVKSSLLKMPVYRKFMKHNMASKSLCEVYMFVNRKKIFNIDSREEFSVIFYNKKNKNDLQLAVNLDEYEEFYKKEKIKISSEVLGLVNPETNMLPNINSNEQLKFLCELYINNPTFSEEYEHCHFGRLVHLTNHSQYIVREKKEGYVPVYEGKFIELYTGKFSTFKGMCEEEKYKNKASARVIKNINNNEYPESRFFIDKGIWNNLSKNFRNSFIIAWRSLTSSTNRRTMLATVLPLVPACQSIQLLQTDKDIDMIQILVLFNSIIFDHIIRMKMAGLDLTQTVIKQIPVPQKRKFENRIVFQGIEESFENHIISRLYFLYKDDLRVRELFNKNQNYAIPNKSRKQTIAELDCLVGYLYGLPNEMIKKIAMTFDKFYSKEEVERWF